MNVQLGDHDADVERPDRTAGGSAAVVLRSFGEPLQLEHYDVPALVDGAVVMRVDFAGICGTDVHLHRGHLPMPTPVVLGHEGVGVVEALGAGVERDALGNPLRPGDRAVWASSIPCGACFYCVRLGERSLCPNRKVYGINQTAASWPHLSGSWAERIYLQPGSTILRIPDEIASEEVIALGCAGPTAVHGLLDVCQVHVGDIVAIQGSGPVGLAAAMYARLAGASRVILLGAPAMRLELAAELRVADEIIDIDEFADPGDRIERVRSASEGRGADVVVEATGVPAAVAEGIEMCRPNGSYLVLGQYTDRGATAINPHVITRKQVKAYGSWAFAERNYIDYLRTLPLLTQRHDIRRLVQRFALTDANGALAAVAAGHCVKAVLVPQR